MAISFDRVNNNLRDALTQSDKSIKNLSRGQRELNETDLAVITQLDAKSTQLDAASKNIDYSSSISAVQDSVYNQAGEILGRIAVLATSSANGTISQAGKDANQAEVSQLQDELQRQIGGAEFNGVPVLDTQTTYQVGTTGGSESQIVASSANISDAISGALAVSVATQVGATVAIDTLTAAVASLASQSSSNGADQARLNSAQQLVSSQRDEFIKSASQIRDVDVADETSKLLSAQITAKAAVAYDAQIKNLNGQNAQNVLR